MRLTNGEAIVIAGVQGPGGVVSVRYPGGHTVVAADAGDYVYPDDIRVDDASGRMYVKAEGLAGGISHETVLFEYDLYGRKALQRLAVDGAVLPPQCRASE
jgi:hypothetical protein